LAIDRNGASDELPGINEHHLLDMVLAHRAVFEIMAEWAWARTSRTNLATEIFDENDDRQRLFPVYCRRAQLWQQCIPLLAYATLRKGAQARFKDLAWDPKRSAFYFTLKRWSSLQREGTRIWPLQVMVREQFDVDDNERFVVISHLYSGSLDTAQAENVEAIAAKLRAKRGTGRKMATGVQRASLRVDYASTQDEAATKLCEHLADLANTFAELASETEPR